MFYRIFALFMVILGSFALSACGGKLSALTAAEWEDLKAHDFGADWKKFTGLGAEEGLGQESSGTELSDPHLYEEYCTSAEWAEGRRLIVSGISEEELAYGGCILEAPVPYEPQRLHGRPYPY